MTMNVETRPYVDRCDHYLSKASEEFSRGDLLQTSEKGWGATAQIIKAVAEERGWEHRRHANLIQVVRRVVAETGDQDLWVAFAMARELHENFYEGQMGETDVDFHLGHVTRFVEKMRGLVDGN